MAISKPTNEQINEFINKELASWSIFAEQTLRASIDKKKLRVTDELYNSISHAQQQATVAGLASVTIGFADEGRILDMKAVTHKKPLSRDVIEEQILPWVIKKGISKFKKIPGYTVDSKRFPTNDEAARRIAWGIGQGIVKGKWVRRAWYARKMSGLIHNLTERLVTDYATVIASSMSDKIVE